MKKAENEIKNRIGVELDEGCFYDDLSIGEMKSVNLPFTRYAAAVNY